MSPPLNLHCIVADILPFSNVVGEIDIADQVLVLKLAIRIVGVQLRLVNRLVFLLFFIILRRSWLYVFSFVAIWSVMSLKTDL